MPTKKELEQQLESQAAATAKVFEEKEALKRQIEEAKRQSTLIPVSKASQDDGGSHALDHGTIYDNHMEPDTNFEPAEDIAARDGNDLSFWNNSWTWVKAAKSYGNKPEDKWFINPTAKLIGEVMLNTPTVFSACEVALVAGSAIEQMKQERERHLEFLRSADSGDLISESLDLMTNYQGRFFEAVQRYIGLSASYQNQVDNPNVNEEQIENAQLRKEDAGKQCRAWAARLIALVESYHSVVSDDRAYKLSFNFDPMPPASGQQPSREYSLLRWAITTTLNKTGRRLARSIKEGKMDAEKYRIPRPWLTEERKTNQLNTNTMLSDFG